MAADRQSDPDPERKDGTPDDEALNRRLVLTAPGENWSGRTRYAAAMYFYQSGRMSAEVLEIYRICSRQDEVDPVDVLTRHCIGEDWLKTLKAFSDKS